MSEFLLPVSVGLFVIVFGFILFKKFIKIVILIALIVGGSVFISQDLFALGLSDFLPGKAEAKSDKVRNVPKSKYVISQSEDGTISVLKRKKQYIFMTVDPDNRVIMFDNVMKYDLGIIESDQTIEKMIKVFFGKPELLNVEDEEKEEGDDE